MKRLMYSPDAIDKLHEIKQDITDKHGAKKAKAVIREMTKAFRGLLQFENQGPAVEDLTGISCDYRVLYVQHNYAFYRVEKNAVRIVNIYNEKEDFMWKLFGIRTTTQETEDYWGDE